MTKTEMTQYVVSLITAARSQDTVVLAEVANDIDTFTSDDVVNLIGVLLGLCAALADRDTNAHGVDLIAAIGQLVAASEATP